jgi:hypothetical protein
MTIGTAAWILDDESIQLDLTLRTWGELLAAVDRRLAGTGRAVTAVRFDGVDQPSFRNSGLARRRLTQIGRIEFESLERAALLRNTIVVAVDGLGALSSGTQRIAGAFRDRDAAAANRELATLLDTVNSLMTLTSAIGQAAGLRLPALRCGAFSGDRAIGRVTDALETLSAWQQTRDWPAVADGLEYELAPALAGWREVLDAMSQECCA